MELGHQLRYRGNTFELDPTMNVAELKHFQSDLASAELDIARLSRDGIGRIPLYEEAERLRAKMIARARELLGLATPPAAEAAIEIDPAAAQPLAQPCPCCGGRMFVIETFEAGCQPRHRPTAPLVAIRIDTS